MKKSQGLDAFNAFLKASVDEHHHLEDRDGSHRLWTELNAEGKLAWIARYAACVNLAAEHFLDAAGELLGQPAAGEAALRLLLEKSKELRRLEKMLPDDGRTESTPLADRFAEILQAAPEPRAAEHDRDVGRGGR